MKLDQTKLIMKTKALVGSTTWRPACIFIEKKVCVLKTEAKFGTFT